jgi:hypothetical protein
MTSNSMKTKLSGSGAHATLQGPADFALGSPESRAAARARVQQILDNNAPRKGDVLIQLEETGWPERHRKIVHVLAGRGRFEGEPERLPGIPLLWVALPAGASPGDLIEGHRKAPGPDGSVATVACSLADIPFFWGLLTANEQRRLLGSEAA